MDLGIQSSNSFLSSSEPNVQLLGKNAWNKIPGAPLRSLLFVLDLSLFWVMSSFSLALLSDPWEGPFPVLLSTEAQGLTTGATALALVLGASLARRKIQYPLLISAWIWDIRTSSTDHQIRRMTYFGPARRAFSLVITFVLILASATGVAWMSVHKNIQETVLNSWKIPVQDFSPEPQALRPLDSETLTLPLFTLLAHWSLQESGSEPYLLSLPFSQKIPEKYLPYARLQQPRLGVQIEIQGPKSISSVAENLLPRFALEKVSEKLHDHSESTGKRKSFESGRHPLSPLSTPNAHSYGVTLQGAQNEIQTHWIGTSDEYILLTVEKKLPRLITLSQTPSEWVLQKNIQAARAYLNQELAQLKLPKESFLPDWVKSGKNPTSPPMNETEFLALFRAENLIGAKLTLDPGSLESWYHFGGVNFWIREASLKREAPELARLAERNFQVALQSLQHLAPQHPLTQELAHLRTLLIQRLQEGP